MLFQLLYMFGLILDVRSITAVSILNSIVRFPHKIAKNFIQEF